MRCECGEAMGATCEATAATVVEWMPLAHRESHTKGGSVGVYPHNGSRRLRVSEVCADVIVAANPGWARRLNPHAVALGRRGGAAKTEAQAAAARENGKKGGRPVEPGSPRWCADAEPGDYLALYEDHDDDGGRLSERGLRLVADHRGLVVEK